MRDTEDSAIRERVKYCLPQLCLDIIVDADKVSYELSESYRVCGLLAGWLVHKHNLSLLETS